MVSPTSVPAGSDTRENRLLLCAGDVVCPKLKSGLAEASFWSAWNLAKLAAKGLDASCFSTAAEASLPKMDFAGSAGVAMGLGAGCDQPKFGGGCELKPLDALWVADGEEAAGLEN